MQDDLNRLISKAPPEISLGAPATPGAIRTKTGLERKQDSTVAGEEVTVQSTDGLFTFTVRVIKA